MVPIEQAKSSQALVALEALHSPHTAQFRGLLNADMLHLKPAISALREHAMKYGKLRKQLDDNPTNAKLLDGIGKTIDWNRIGNEIKKWHKLKNATTTEKKHIENNWTTRTKNTPGPPHGTTW
ncbi:hypothetical protein LTR53_009426, partial [Teratosphaeriaceae sp. CCFEE 6253]